MCQIGDILLIYNASVNRKPIGVHPFIVLDDQNDVVSGVYAYDFIGLLLSSANTEEKRERLNKFDGNFPIAPEDKIMSQKYSKDNVDSFVKADNFFYFDKSKIKYMHIGSLEPDILSLITEFIAELIGKGVKINQILDKATRIDK